MLYGDIETEPIDKDWLFGFKDEINEADWMCIAPYEDEWEVVKSFIDDASEGKGEMYGLEKLCKEFPYVPMAVDKKTGITVGAYPTEYNPRFTNIFHVIYRIKMKDMMKNQKAQNNYYNNGGFQVNPPQTNYMKVDCMGTQSTTNNNVNQENKVSDSSDLAVLREAYHEYDEPEKICDFDITKKFVMTDKEEKEDGYGIANDGQDVNLNTNPDHNWHPNRNQFGQFNTPFNQGVNPYQYNPRTSFNSSSYLSGYRGTVPQSNPNMSFSCFADGYANRERAKQEAMRVNQMVNQSNPRRLEPNYTDFSNPESVQNMQNPYGYLNAYSNPNLRGGNPYQPPIVNTPYSYGPAMYNNNNYGYNPYPVYSSTMGNDDFMIPTEEEIEAGYAVRTRVTEKKIGEEDEVKQTKPYVSYTDRIEKQKIQVSVKVVKINQDDEEVKKEEIVKEEDKGEVKYDIPNYGNGIKGINLRKYNENPKYNYFEVSPILEDEVMNICEKLSVYNDAIAMNLYTSLRDKLTLEEFTIYKNWCIDKLKWYMEEEKKHPELDFRLDYRYREDPRCFRGGKHRVIDRSYKNREIEQIITDKNGRRMHQFDRGHEITEEEMQVFFDKATMERDDIIREGLQKKILDRANQLVDEEDYNPNDPISVRIHEVKVQQKQARNNYNIYKRAYKHLMTEKQFDNWWFGGSMNVPNMKLTPLQQRMKYVERMTDLRCQEIRNNLIPINYEARRNTFLEAERKAFRDFDQGCMEGVKTVREYFDKLGYLMSRVDELNRQEWFENRKKQRMMKNEGLYNYYLDLYGRNRFIYDQYGNRLPERETPYVNPYLNQTYVEFINSDAYADRRRRFLGYCHDKTKGPVQLKPIYK